MTNEQAYVEGFCKAAEVMGVDPAALVKRADAKALVLRLLASAGKPLATAGKAAKNAGGSAVNRYIELLRGGNAAKLDKLHRGGAWDGVLGHSVFGPGASAGTAVVPFDADVANRVKRLQLLNPLKRRLSAVRGSDRFDKDVVSEVRKALAAQLGTGLAAGGTAAGGGYALGRAGNDGK